VNLQKRIEQHWYNKINVVLWIILLPLSGIFWLISVIRRTLYSSGISKSYRLARPVIIVGNLTVGGNGKTPVTSYIYRNLTARGYTVGIILRGYKAKLTDSVVVDGTHDAADVGDEAYNYFADGFIVAIGSDRVKTGQILLAKHPEIDYILSDDGLQHYRLQRDYEICVVDATRWFGNGMLIPDGPLRESLSRLRTVNHIVVNSLGDRRLLSRLIQYQNKISYSKLQLTNIYNHHTRKSRKVQEFAQDKIVLLCGIGNPERFFDFAKCLGIISSMELAFNDHHDYVASEVVYPEYQIITTSKDYVKLQKFGLNNIWVLNIEVELDNELLINQIMALTC